MKSIKVTILALSLFMFSSCVPMGSTIETPYGTIQSNVNGSFTFETKPNVIATLTGTKFTPTGAIIPNADGSYTYVPKKKLEPATQEHIPVEVVEAIKIVDKTAIPAPSAIIPSSDTSGN